ncbi:MAG: diguanylate cyclase [Eubacterium sp.]|nr:diguanylate cyclase [Eubacterium sp.]
MKSIRIRLVATFVGVFLGVFALLVAISVFYQGMQVESYASKSMELITDEGTTELNTYFSGVERAVETLEDYILETTDVEEFKTSESYRESIYEDVKNKAYDMAYIIEDMESVYFRANAELYGGTAGFFLTRAEDDELKDLTPTDILAYEEDDLEHVGWYYEPIYAGGPIWMEPYTNENISVYMISYVIPVYQGDDFLGIIGMDIDMTLIHEVVDKDIYENSSGMLVGESGNLLYHMDYPGGLNQDEFTGEIAAASKYFSDEYADTGENYTYSLGTLSYRIICSRLENGMLLATVVPESELFIFRNRMIFQFTILFIVLLVIVAFISVKMVKRVLNPIKELTEISSRIAKGELNQEIDYTNHDEIGDLADGIRKISVELNDYIEYIHGQAYLDVMTGVQNKAAYLAEEMRLERLIKEKMAAFTVYVFDINGLKRMNDSKGHEYGDMLIKDAVLNIKTVFGSENVYRIGGDEFIVLTGEESEEEIRRQLARFDERIRLFNSSNDKYEDDLSVSRGVAVFNPEVDKEFASVFSRADEDMYRCKAEYYKSHGDRRQRT